MCEVAYSEHLANDDRFTDKEHRAAHQVKRADVVQRRFGSRPVWQETAELAAHGVTLSPVYACGDIGADRQVSTMQLVQDIDTPTLGPTPTVVFRAWIAEHLSRAYGWPPKFGARIDEASAEWLES